MDEPPSDYNNPAKRRCPNDRESDTLFMPRSPESTTLKKSPTVEETLEENDENDEEEEDEIGDDANAGESTYDKSQEPFPAHPAFDPAIDTVKDQAASLVKRLESLLGQYASVNKDLENMKEKTAEVMKSGSPRRMRIGLLGGTAAGKSSLINSLTDCPGLAKEVCRSVTTTKTQFGTELTRVVVCRRGLHKRSPMVDLPGTTDTNRVRVRATHEHLRQCQALWYIVSVERPCTDPDLEYAVSSYADRFPGKLAVIVTKVDRDVNDALANDMKNKDQDVGDFYDHKASIKEHNKCLRSVRTKLKRKSCTATQRNTLRDQEDALMASIEKLEALKFECVVGARNAHISAILKWDKAEYLPDGEELPVYCVSNRHYAVYRGVAAREGPLLGVKSTGIPDLRAYALTLAAPSVWESHKEILVHKLKVLFHGVHGWAQTSPTRSNRGLPQVFKPMKSLWEAIAKASVDHCISVFSSVIVGKLRAEHASSFAELMRYHVFLNDKNEWHPASFLAFFRNNGRHTTKTAGTHVWNEAFIKWQRVNVIDPTWDDLPNPQDSFDVGVDKVIKSLEDIPEQLNSLPESVPLSTAAFINMLHGQVALIRINHDRLKAEYQDKYGNIKLDACLDQNSGHFTQAMKPCYREGRDDKGEGVCARLKKLLSDHLTKKDPLGQATDKLETALKNMAKSQGKRLRTKVDRVLKEVDGQFESILRRGTETPAETKARAEINEVLRELMPEVERIEFDLKAIERKYMGALVQQ